MRAGRLRGHAGPGEALCEGLCQVLTLPCTQAQLAAVTKKNTAVLAVQNAELAKLCASAAGTAPSHH